jgi:hypothetical protein
MSQMASFPQDHQHILMENGALDPSFSSLNTPTPGAKWPSDLRHEPPASAADPMNTPSVVVDSNPVYGGVNAPNSSPFMTRIPQDSGPFQEPNWRFYDSARDGSTYQTYDQPRGSFRLPQPPQYTPNAAPNAGVDGMPNGYHHPTSATNPADNFRTGGIQVHLATNTANTLLRASHNGGEHAVPAEETASAILLMVVNVAATDYAFHKRMKYCFTVSQAYSSIIYKDEHIMTALTMMADKTPRKTMKALDGFVQNIAGNHQISVQLTVSLVVHSLTVDVRHILYQRVQELTAAWLNTGDQNLHHLLAAIKKGTIPVQHNTSSWQPWNPETRRMPI